MDNHEVCNLEEVQRLTFENTSMKNQIQKLNQTVAQCLERLAKEQRSQTLLQQRIAQLEKKLHTATFQSGSALEFQQRSGKPYHNSSYCPTPKPRLMSSKAPRLSTADKQTEDKSTMEGSKECIFTYDSSLGSSKVVDEQTNYILGRIMSKLQTQHKQILMLSSIIRSNGVLRPNSSEQTSVLTSSCRLPENQINSGVNTLPNQKPEQDEIEDLTDYENILTGKKGSMRAGNISKTSTDRSETGSTTKGPVHSPPTDQEGGSDDNLVNPDGTDQHRRKTLHNLRSINYEQGNVVLTNGAGAADSENQLNPAKQSEEISPSCSKTGLSLNQLEYETQAMVCTDTKADCGELSPDMEMSVEELRTCPICNFVVPYELGQEKFEAHVMHHFPPSESLELSMRETDRLRAC